MSKDLKARSVGKRASNKPLSRCAEIYQVGEECESGLGDSFGGGGGSVEGVRQAVL